MSLQHIRDALVANNGRFASIWYKGLDDQLRHRVVRIGVKKYIKHHFPTKNMKPHPDILKVYDVTNKGYRSIRIKSIIAAQIDKQLWLA